VTNTDVTMLPAFRGCVQRLVQVSYDCRDTVDGDDFVTGANTGCSAGPSSIVLVTINFF